jgi:sulfur carrier protein
VGVARDTVSAVEVIVNGCAAQTRAATLGALLEEQGYAGLKVATALNGSFVPESARDRARLGAGDRVEIVSARPGG